MACNFIKKRLQHRCFTEICQIFKKTFSYKTPPVAVSNSPFLTGQSFSKMKKESAARPILCFILRVLKMGKNKKLWNFHLPNKFFLSNDFELIKGESISLIFTENIKMLS